LSTVDLHLHSHHSDGLLSPSELAAVLAAHAIQFCALTDHDTVAGLDEFADAATKVGITTIPGIELSTDWRGKTLHVLALGIDPSAQIITEAVQHRLTVRRERAQQIASKLDRAGQPGSEALRRFSQHGAPTRTHFAQALVALGAAASMDIAFKRWLSQGQPGYVKTEWPSLSDTLRTITQGGGTAVLAHPLRYRLSAGQRRTLLTDFKSDGGVAIEVVTGGAAMHQIETATGLALRAGLEASQGSDCHDPSLAWQRPGRLAKLPSALVPVWHRFGFKGD